jgi:hypothetical protein
MVHLPRSPHKHAPSNPSSATNFAAPRRTDERAVAPARAANPRPLQRYTQPSDFACRRGPSRISLTTLLRANVRSGPSIRRCAKPRNLSGLGAVAGGRSAIELDACCRAARMIPPRRNMRRRSPIAITPATVKASRRRYEQNRHVWCATENPFYVVRRPLRVAFRARRGLRSRVGS